MKKQNNRISEFFQLAGNRYWTASLLPVLLGTTLPFWLNPPDFKFRLLEGILFLIVIFFGHVGFSLLFSGFSKRINSKLKKKRFLFWGFSV